MYSWFNINEFDSDALICDTQIDDNQKEKEIICNKGNIIHIYLN